MMNSLRAAMLLFLTCYSCLFMAAFLYSIRDAFNGGSMSLDIPLFLNSLLWASAILLTALLISVSPLGDKIVSLFLRPAGKASGRRKRLIRRFSGSRICTAKNMALILI
tara:strand:- start:1402 stop:1728 length:327 start_codon:yes stop_codon:yes gene_type:complete